MDDAEKDRLRAIANERMTQLALDLALEIARS
jgi:hypothetical protein